MSSVIKPKCVTSTLIFSRAFEQILPAVISLTNAASPPCVLFFCKAVTSFLISLHHKSSLSSEAVTHLQECAAEYGRRLECLKTNWNIYIKIIKLISFIWKCSDVFCFLYCWSSGTYFAVFVSLFSFYSMYHSNILWK